MMIDWGRQVRESISWEAGMGVAPRVGAHNRAPKRGPAAKLRRQHPCGGNLEIFGGTGVCRHPRTETFPLDTKKSSRNRRDVHIYEGDCNSILLEKIFPLVSYSQYRRGLCLLDPYGLHLNWEVVSTAGSMRSLEIFLNFPVADMNRNVLWRNPDRVDRSQIKRINSFWGDDTWIETAYQVKQYGMFGDVPEKSTNMEIVDAFKDRLLHAAGFKFVPNPLPMVNRQDAVIYYLFFASHNETGKKIVAETFNKYRKGMSYDA